MRKMIGLLFILLFSSCSYYFGPVVEVINNSDFELSEVVVYTSDEFSSLRFTNIESQNHECNRLDMSESAHHPSDGAYGVRYTFIGMPQRQVNSFGYFSNGHAMYDKIYIEIKNDTTLFTYE
ncbi:MULTISPECIES: hypothetical protein [unclassified Nonlabens]|uniref:hypothetical protein n=1 Tax=unclassified Nonlabens TaxID=2615035 RepID=UPI00386A2B4E